MKINFLLPLSLLLVSALSHATNGYFTHGKSLIEKAQAGAGVAQVKVNYGLNLNPAQLNNGQHESGFEAGLVVFSPSRKYQVTGQPSACGSQCPFSIGAGNQTITSENEVFYIPQFGLRYQLDDISHINFSIFANGGMNTEYKGGTAQLGPQGTSVELDGTFGDGTTGVDLVQVFTAVTYSRNITNDLALGASIFYAYQQIELTGLGNFAGMSTNPMALSSEGVDSSDGIGWRVGGQYKLSSAINIGATYQAKVSMSKFDDYAGLFAEQGKFDIPSSWAVGLAYQLTPSSEFLLDFQSINYSEISAIANSISPLTKPTSCTATLQGGNGAGCLGGAQGAGFGWADMEIYKMAYKFNYSNQLTLRAGVSKTEQPINNQEVLFAILTPAVIEYHYTLGASYQFLSNDNLHLSLMYAPENSQSGKNTFDPDQDITVSMSQFEVGVSYQMAW